MVQMILQKKFGITDTLLRANEDKGHLPRGSILWLELPKMVQSNMCPWKLVRNWILIPVNHKWSTQAGKLASQETDTQKKVIIIISSSSTL